jgi:hydroxyacylglutathione hydrolase
MNLVHDGDRLRLRVVTGGPFQENTWLVECGSTGALALVDPGAASPEAVRWMEGEGRRPEAIWLTHAHLDHVDGIPGVVAAFPEIPVALHPDDLPLYRRAPDQARAYGIPFQGELPEPDAALAAGATLTLGDLSFQVRFAPGHAPGHVIFVEAEAGVALVGDVIFQRSVGRTDLPGGDTATLLASIRTQVLTLPDATRLFPGHGPPTTVGEERHGNPFLRPATGPGGGLLA